MSAVALTAVHVSSEDEFLVWLHRHPEASRRQAWEAGIHAAEEAVEKHAADCASCPDYCCRRERALDDLI